MLSKRRQSGDSQTHRRSQSGEIRILRLWHAKWKIWRRIRSIQIEGRGTFGSRETRLVNPINAEPLNGRVEVALPEIQRANGTKVEISQHRVADTPTEAVAQTKERHTPSQRLSTSTGTARNRTKRLHDLKVGHEGRKAQTRTVGDPISLDELAALGADNKLLKRLLAELLLAQNLWLKKMLERFDAERDVAPLASGRKAREPEFRG